MDDYSTRAYLQLQKEQDEAIRQQVMRDRSGNRGAIPGEEDVYLTPETLGDMNLYYVKDYIDTRLSNFIVRGPKGTFYIGESKIPRGFDVEPAKFMYNFGGESTTRWLSGYLAVSNEVAGNLESGVYNLRDRRLAERIYVQLKQRGRNVQLEDTRIVILTDRYYVDREIEELLQEITGAHSKRMNTRHRQRVQEMTQDIVDDDYEF